MNAAKAASTDSSFLLEHLSFGRRGLCGGIGGQVTINRAWTSSTVLLRTDCRYLEQNLEDPGNLQLRRHRGQKDDGGVVKLFSKEPVPGIV